MTSWLLYKQVSSLLRLLKNGLLSVRRSLDEGGIEEYLGYKALRVKTTGVYSRTLLSPKTDSNAVDEVFFNGLLLFLTAIFLVACSSTTPLEKALKEAGSNRVELEKVLKYYEDEPEKQKAAIFLIENMPGHKSSESISLGSILNIIQQCLLEGAVTSDLEKRGKAIPAGRVPGKSDIKIISAKYLIENIELAFEVKSRPWNKELSFEAFCEWLLPYRISDEPLTNWRKAYHEKYAPILDSIYTGKNAVEACRALCEYLAKEGFMYSDAFAIPNLPGTFLLDHKFGTCREGCMDGLYAMRAVGIPCSIDIFPWSPEYRVGHLWNVVYNPKEDTIHPFWYSEFLPSVTPGVSDQRKKGKVYRLVYDSNHLSDNVQYKQGLKDVTGQYFGDNLVYVKIPEAMVQPEGVSLSVFSSEGWRIVDQGTYDKVTGYALFRNLEQNVVFQPIAVLDNKLSPISYPFILDEQNQARYFIPSRKTQGVILKRKYPLRRKTASYRSSLVGVKIYGLRGEREIFLTQVSSRKLSNKVTLVINHKGAFDGIRLRPNLSGKYDWGEVTLYTPAHDTIPVVRIDTNNSPNTWYIAGTPGNLIDNDPLTYYSHQAHTCQNSRIDLYFQDIEYLGEIQLTPRNDDNFIRIGDEYELYYHGGIAGWLSLGRKIATADSIVYSHVPEGALLWLKNHTRGIEEQVFTYDGNRQIFPTYEELELHNVIE